MIMVAGFRFWQHHSQVLRMSRVACTSAVAKWSSALALWEGNLSRRLMQHWRRLTPARLASASQLRALTVLHASFFCWKSAVQEYERCGLSGVAYHNTTHLPYSFQSWRLASREANRAAASVLHMQRRVLQRSFDIIRAVATAARRLDAKAANHSVQNIKKRGWQLLRSGVAKAARLREAEAVLHRLSTERRAAEMLMLWYAATQTAFKRQARTEHAMAQWRSRLLVAAMAGWCRRVQSIARKKRLVQVCHALLMPPAGGPLWHVLAFRGGLVQYVFFDG